MHYPKRKRTRLKDFDYSQNGAYFITICTKDKKCLFSPVGADSISARAMETILLHTIENYPQIECPIYVIMPNHIHFIITIVRADMESAPTISEFIQTFKRHSTVKYIKLVKQGIVPPFEKQIWQRFFHDHIIRNEQDYLEIWKYIENNPAQWEEDSLYIK